MSVTTERGVVCGKCGADEWYTKRPKRCAPCRREQGRKWRRENPEKKLAWKRRWWRRNPDKTEEVARRAHLSHKYGITPDEYDAMLEAQGGVCVLCEGTCASGRRLSVDHCHETGRIRGLLCGLCNAGIGMLQDDPSLLRAAALYLEAANGE